MGKGGHLGEMEQLMVLTILRLKDQAYGLNIQKELEQRAGRRVSPGALYATLDRLEGKGVVTSRFADPEPGRGGKPRRYVEVTAEGIKTLQQARYAWRRLAEGLDGIVEGL